MVSGAAVVMCMCLPMGSDVLQFSGNRKHVLLPLRAFRPKRESHKVL